MGHVASLRVTSSGYQHVTLWRPEDAIERASWGETQLAPEKIIGQNSGRRVASGEMGQAPARPNYLYKQSSFHSIRSGTLNSNLVLGNY
jgi:hypothetical protein